MHSMECWSKTPAAYSLELTAMDRGRQRSNIIAYNASAGISVIGDAAQGNSIRGNAIYSNGGLGIDLGG